MANSQPELNRVQQLPLNRYDVKRLNPRRQYGEAILFFSHAAVTRAVVEKRLSRELAEVLVSRLDEERMQFSLLLWCGIRTWEQDRGSASIYTVDGREDGAPRRVEPEWRDVRFRSSKGTFEKWLFFSEGAIMLASQEERIPGDLRDGQLATIRADGPGGGSFFEWNGIEERARQNASVILLGGNPSAHYDSHGNLRSGGSSRTPFSH